MSAFDITVRVSEGTIVPLEEGDKIYEAQLVLGIITLIPIGPEQAAPLPLGVIRAPFDKDGISRLIKGLQDVHDKMDKRPDIAIATALPDGLR